MAETCNCYQFESPCSTVVTYTDCDKGTETSLSVVSGQTYQVCSSVPLTLGDCAEFTPVETLGECVDNKCPKNTCYILYSCDGSYEPILSDVSGLSSYTSSFVSIEINEPPTTPDTCFYVLELGPIECEITYDITVVSGGTCSCPCYCYFIKSATETTDVTYVNCDDEIVVETIQSGLTYNICSKVYPQFDVPVVIPIKLTDICENGQCPPTIPSVKPPNECDVITIFPMGVECIVVNPTNDKTFDGAATLSITGGTPPYTISWEIGSFAPALTNLGVGEYSATVVDYYGDFTANTTCVLTAETMSISGMCFVVSGVVSEQLVYISTESIGLKNGKPHYFLQFGTEQLGYVFWDTISETWVFCQTLDCQTTPYNTLDNSGNFYPTGATGDWIVVSETNLLIEESYVGLCQLPSITKEVYDLCVSLEVLDKTTELPTISVINIDMSPSSDINGQPSWSSVTGQYVIYWNTGSTPSQWTLTGYSPTSVFINNDSSYPPLSNWQILGAPQVIQIGVTTGVCSSEYSVFVNAVENDSVCNQLGSITVTASGGLSPYMFSIDGGTTYQSSPIFNNLTPGIYSVTAKDSNDVVGTFVNITVDSVPPTTYNLTLNVNYTNNTFSITAPTLPGGVTLSVDLVMVSNFQYYPVGITPTPSYNNFTTIDGLYSMNLTNVVSNVVSISGPCTITGTVNEIQQQKTFTNTLTFTSNQTITGTTSDSIINSPLGVCRSATGSYSLSIVNPVVNNCSCCTLTLNNPPLPILRTQ